MFLHTNQIVLRAMEPQDTDTLYEWENNLELWEVSNTTTPLSKQNLEEFISASHQDIYTNKQLRLIVQSKADNSCAGTIDLFDFDPTHGRVSLGIYVHHTHRGKGFAFDAIELIKHYCFQVLHLHQIHVDINAANTESLSLFQKCGFHSSGIKKAWRKGSDGKFSDVVFMQCISSLEA